MPMISALLSPLSSASTCWPAPSEGVLVTAPEKMPRMTASGMSSSRCSRDDHEAAQADDGHGYAVQAQAALAQRGEEARAHLDADRVDEQDEPELLDEVHRVLVEREIVAGEEVSDDDAAEKAPRRCPG